MRAGMGVLQRGARRALVAGVLLGGALSANGPAAFAEQPKPDAAASPIYGVTIPPGYRKWEMVAPAEEAAPLDELRVVLGNPVAIRALEQATLPFPDGTILVKLAYKRKQSDEFASATVPGKATTVQVMVKDSRRYASTGGWGFGRFINGVPADIGQHQTCFACHQALVKNHDYVFTRLAP
ncbi:cytochrome P460 family protein [Burkholderia sp. BCC1999]|uniref:cytochrome P460 family protein n=1 Tax=Burkholderia sp. BCC1999 TaxID=2817448 RepID=UPI002AC32BDF|nr:cytochrome P460 family protein [Burkholderia sp. BCC1999]